MMLLPYIGTDLLWIYHQTTQLLWPAYHMMLLTYIGTDLLWIYHQTTQLYVACISSDSALNSLRLISKSSSIEASRYSWRTQPNWRHHIILLMSPNYPYHLMPSKPSTYFLLCVTHTGCFLHWASPQKSKYELLRPSVKKHPVSPDD